MGRRTREFSIEVFVIGPNYDSARDALISAIEQPGPGELEHPYFGTLRVSIINASKKESTREGGKATFSLTCVESGDLALPTVTADTKEKVVDSVDKSIAAAIDDFSKAFDVVGQAADFVQSVIDEVDAVLGAIEDVVGSVTGPIADLIRAPAEMAGAISGALNNVQDLVNDPLQALSIYKTLFDAGNGRPIVPTNTANRKRQALNTFALHSLIERVAIAEAARSSANASFTTREEALAVQSLLVEAIDEKVEALDPVNAEPVEAEVYASLADLRTMVARDLRIRGARLPELITYTPHARLPALVIAHTIYGDARRDDEIIARNHLNHPGFVIGGQSLEVISE